MIRVPDEVRPVMEALLMGLDPRLPQAEQADAMIAATVADPEFVVGVLTSLVTEQHARHERIRGLAPGTLVDILRAETLGAPPAWPADALTDAADRAMRYTASQIRQATEKAARWGSLRQTGELRDPWDRTPPRRDGDLRRLDGGQLQEWGEGRWHDVEDPPPSVVHLREPGEPRFSTGGPIPAGVREEFGNPAEVHRDRWDRRPDPDGADRVGTGPNGEWTVADAAIDAERARRARQAAELGLTAPPVGGRDQTGGEAVSEPLRPVSGDPRVAPLLRRLAAQRRDERAIDMADPDRPETMRPAMTAALDPAQAADDALNAPDGGNVQQTGPTGETPDYAACGYLTTSGPCILRAGHPELPVPGTEQGHMSEEKLR